MFLFCILPTWAETRSETIKVLGSGLVISSCPVQVSVLCVEVFESSTELFELKGTLRKRMNDTGRFSVRSVCQFDCKYPTEYLPSSINSSNLSWISECGMLTFETLSLLLLV